MTVARPTRSKLDCGVGLRLIPGPTHRAVIGADAAVTYSPLHQAL